MTESTWPKKQRELRSHHFDSTVWNDFKFRDDDIVIASYAKSGTTWVQQIVAQLLFRGAEGLAVAEMSPWLDLRVPPAAVKLAALEAQTHRRFVKTHLPVDALVFSPAARYLYVGRDGRDIVWSLHNHHVHANDTWYGAINDTPGRVGPPIGPPPADVVEYFRAWLEGDGFPFWSYWESVRSWWALRALPNVLLLHFGELKRDLAGQIRRVAAFLDIAVDDALVATIVAHSSFDYMKRHATQSVPLGGAFWEGGAQTFIHKGQNGRWRDVLTPALCEAYEARARAELGDECATWLLGPR